MVCASVLAALSLPLASGALASGTGTSAGDQQYVDPLTTTTTTPAPTTTSTSPASAPATGKGGSFSGSFFPSSSTTSGGSTNTTASSGSGTLPFTGLNVEACVALGLGLFGTGLILRRTIARG
jgi:hypothetical protein